VVFIPLCECFPWTKDPAYSWAHELIQAYNSDRTKKFLHVHLPHLNHLAYLPELVHETWWIVAHKTDVLIEPLHLVQGDIVVELEVAELCISLMSFTLKSSL